jgi:transposase
MTEEKQSGRMSKKLMDRWKIINMHQLGFNVTQIRRKVGCSRPTIYKWINHGGNGDSVGDAPRSGRPKKLTKTLKKRIGKMMDSKKWKSKRVVANILKQKGIDISYASVARAAKAEGLLARRPPRKPLQKKGNKYKRRKFVEEARNIDWTKVVFADEKKFMTYATPNKQNNVIWCHPNDKLESIPQVKHGDKINAFAIFDCDLVSTVYLFEENMNKDVYIDILEKVLLPATDHLDYYIYLHDNDPKHTSKAAQEWIKMNCYDNIAKESWPGYSPDLNAIENAWAMVGNKVAQLGPRNKGELIKSIKKAWEEVMTKEYRMKLVESMPRRLTAVHKNNGGPTKY